MKTYIKPTTDVIEIKVQQLLAASPTTSSSEWQNGDPVLSPEGNFEF